jgi:hypothetical protein
MVSITNFQRYTLQLKYNFFLLQSQAFTIVSNFIHCNFLLQKIIYPDIILVELIENIKH